MSMEAAIVMFLPVALWGAMMAVMRGVAGQRVRELDPERGSTI
jgi:hypothetical protein